MSACTELDIRLMPLTRSEFLRFAYDLAEKSGIDHRFNKETRMAGKVFFLTFKTRNPNLALRTPEATNLMRATGFNKPQVDRFLLHSLKTPRTVRIPSF